ncbi:MAG TPA: hypothetical protein DDX16_07950, partial [Candidatus Omnitrophica bacterium]|nr:hypothetical protein [Candidatus Omnitrophota bacterium]
DNYENVLEFWIKRIHYSAKFFDGVRVDHLLGFLGEWLIEKGEKAADGAFYPVNEDEMVSWGRKILISLAEAALGDGIVLIGEDIGERPPKVRKMLDGLSEQLPNLFLYNVAGWREKEMARQSHTLICEAVFDSPSTFITRWPELSDSDKEQVKGFLSDHGYAIQEGESPEAISIKVIAAMKKCENLFYSLTLQTVEGWVENSRINIPGTVGPHNWTWRMPVTIESLIERENLNPSTEKTSSPVVNGSLRRVVKGSAKKIKKISMGRAAKLVWVKTGKEADIFEIIAKKKEEINKSGLPQVKGLILSVFEKIIKRIANPIFKAESHFEAVEKTIEELSGDAKNLGEKSPSYVPLTEAIAALENLEKCLLGEEPSILLPYNYAFGEPICIIAEKIIDLELYNTVRALAENIAGITSDVGKDHRVHWAEKNVLNENIVPFFPDEPVYPMVKEGDTILINGIEDTLIINPSQEDIDSMLAWRAQEDFTISGTAMTKDNKPVNISVELGDKYTTEEGMEDAIGMMRKYGIADIGILALEQLYLRKDFVKAGTFPREEYVTDMLIRLADNIGEGMLAVRPYDRSPDKDRREFSSAGRLWHLDFSLRSEMGIAVTETNTRSILKAYAGSDKQNISLVWPNVSNKDDMYDIRYLVEKTKRKLIDEGFIDKFIEEFPQDKFVKIKEGTGENLGLFVMKKIINARDIPADLKGKIKLVLKLFRDKRCEGQKEDIYANLTELFNIKMTYMIEDEEGARNAEYFVNYGDIMFGLGDLERILKGDIYRMHALIKNVVETAAKYKKDNISRKITLAGGPANNEEFLPFFLYLLSLHQNIYLCPVLGQAPNLKRALKDLDYTYARDTYSGLFTRLIPEAL